MAAANTDKFRKKTNLFSTNLSGSITDSATSLTCDSLTGVPTDTAVTVTIDRVDSNGTSTPSKREDVTGVVSSNTLTNLLRGEGSTTAQAHDDNAVVEITWETETWNDAVDGMLVEHNQDGTHDTSIVTTLTGTQTLTNKTLTSPAIGTSVTGSAVLDDDTFATASATTIATSESIKAYVDANSSTSPTEACRVATSGQTITTASATDINFDSEEFDTDTMHDNSTNNQRITFTTAGKYLITGSVNFASNSTGGRQVLIVHSGEGLQDHSSTPAVSGFSTRLNVSTIINCGAGSYATLRVYQDSGGDLAVLSAYTYFSAHRLS